MKQTGKSQEEIVKRVHRLLEERGRKALEMAKKEMLQEKIKCKEVREALDYFMTEYWQDLARPALLSLCCEAVGGDHEATIPIAIPLSLISGGIDIHDDIIDQSKIKHSRLTVLGKFGKDIALLVGDALLLKGLTLLHDAVEKGVPTEGASIVLDIVKRMFFELGDAEALELRFRGRVNVAPEEYLNVVKKKAADVEALARISAILGDGSDEEIEKLGNYGRLLGMILILRDDILDATDYAETLHRIEKECLPLPILCALQSDKTGSGLVSMICRQPLTKRDVENIQESTARSGGLEGSQNILNELAKDACLFVQKIDKSGDLKAFAIACCVPYLKREIKAGKAFWRFETKKRLEMHAYN
ncbi:MAG: polyprenyl synthetase family protein [Candidatus Bathyarchaeota archaeon]|nr:MAG: polyprenyl synthetase family protein [Candidatus Bathyarchaeota archaeon]